MEHRTHRIPAAAVWKPGDWERREGRETEVLRRGMKGCGHVEVLHPRHRLKAASTGFPVRVCRGCERAKLALPALA